MGLRRITCLLLLISLLHACGMPAPRVTQQLTTPAPSRATQPADSMYIERLDARLDALIAPGTTIELLASGYEWAEGPQWVGPAEGGSLVFSDVPTNRAYRWTEATGVELLLEPSGFTGAYFGGKEPGSNRLFLDPQGNLLLCQHGDRRIARMEAPLDAPEAKFATVVADYGGKRLNSPNDIAWHRNGDLYFTDPPYGLPGGQGESCLKELDFQGVYRFRFADSTLTLLTAEMNRPNGLAFTPDHGALIVANSESSQAVWRKYPVAEDGTLGEGQVWFDATEQARGGAKGVPDGMVMHSSGVLFATGPGGIFVLDEAAQSLGIIRTGQATANCTLNADESVLYITADSLLLRMPLAP